ncbi:outer membrane protein assembly factor BamA [Candidatus Methylospira mobilis]|uniref:Outer membrane protein assembly factor BamA n=1 Tax=Candidatus Methylospira mobilis TaxID=1808979 RepID=A0A5Q0BQN4_9GAMM|nr:outer membrane protein assembly factor BamA [Candidatus Methylospira mobilis]QFY44006.1 outer membrane protein assembly factor BamA [Candidatus Methylospira mobilis]WNV05010.1 outer membrane protein assembly factor BamA [Candidatus Methylospira mobilis]
MKLRSYFVLLMFLLCSFGGVSVRGESGFVIEDIRIEGLERISAGTVFNYLPVKVGDTFTQRQATESIKALFKTGFFKDVRLDQDGDVLVVHVEERPSISSVKIEGNKDISTEDLMKGLKGIGLSEGRVFDRQVLDKVEQELRRQYYSRGKYGLKIDSEVTEQSRNRVSVTISISEGKIAKIRQINLVGNNAFTDDELLKTFELSTGNLLSFYTKDNQYSKQKLSADLERLRSFYLDRGYIKFDIESTQVSITPDKKEIYLNINLKEGEVYTVKEVKLTGKTIVPPEELVPLVQIGPTDTFSRKLSTETSKAVSDRLGDEGYIFANVNMVPDIDDAARTVNITFFVDPGKQVYVRRINVTGNTKTRDEVLRREMRQMEGAWASTTKIERSKMRLSRLGYFQDVNVETPSVPGTADQIDVNYAITEKSSGNMMAGVGYSQYQGIIFNASITQDNIFGSGKRVSFNFNNSQYNRIYKIGYLNPYTTLDGLSTGWDAQYTSTNTQNISYQQLASYSSTNLTVGANMGIPLGEFMSAGGNADFQYWSLSTNQYTSENIMNYLNSCGKSYGNGLNNGNLGSLTQQAGSCNAFSNYLVAGSFAHDTLNRSVFATSGGMQRLSLQAAIPGSSLPFYKVSARVQHYFPIASDVTLMLNADLGYANGYNGKELPFFQNFYAGGPQSVRGFYPSSLGPRTVTTTCTNSAGTVTATNVVGDQCPSGSTISYTDRAFGGTAKLVFNAELLFPLPFMSDNKSIRLGPFFDAGNVFDPTSYGLNYSLKQLKYSVGLGAKWLSPFGALSFSIAQPLNADPVCQANAEGIVVPTGNCVMSSTTQRFQFTFGQGF